ncbi:hypothetical protein DFH09DRAFT_1496708 [Mycena vulgaris]|nr:hypothetical protein DFH09DRAFT_1496708 [Mycena vulgaris]
MVNYLSLGLALAICAVAASTVTDRPSAYLDAEFQPASVKPAHCTSVYDIRDLEALSGWSEFEKYLAGEQLENPYIGRDTTGIPTDSSRCKLNKRRTVGDVYTTPGIVNVSYAAGFSTAVTMTMRNNATIAPGASSSVYLALPSIENVSVAGLARVSVVNTRGQKYLHGGVCCGATRQRVSLYSPIDSRCYLTYSAISCAASVSARIPLVATGWVFATSVQQNRVVAANLQAINSEDRSAYMEFEGDMEYYATADWDAFCKEGAV